MYYLCNLTDAKSVTLSPVEVNMNVTTQPTNVTGLLPDTAYRVDCVAYHGGGVEACVEANTTVTTRESLIRLCTFSKRECMYVQVSM